MHDAAQSQSNCGVLVSSSQGLSVKNPSLLSARQANLSSSTFSSSSSTTFSSVSSSISHFLRLFLHASLHSISPSYSQIFLTPSIDLRIPLLDVDERVQFSRKSLSNDAPLPPLRSVGCLWSLHHNRFPTLALRKWISIADYFFTLVESRRFLCSHTPKTGLKPTRLVKGRWTTLLHNQNRLRVLTYPFRFTGLSFYVSRVQ